MAQILMAGHFGAGNVGDDAIMLGFLEGLGQSGVEATVMSGTPEETFRSYGVRGIPRKDKGAFASELENIDALVFAGGSIFQDVTSVKSAIFYASLVKKAKQAGKKVYLVGQGVGPLTSFFGKRAAIGAFNAADAVVVRDPISAQTLKDLGVRRPVSVGADLAFLLQPPPPSSGGDSSFAVADMKSVGVAPRMWGKNSKEVVACFGEFCRLMFQARYVPVLIPMDRHQDTPMIQAICDAQGGKIPDLRKITSPTQLQARLSRMEAIVSMRLHGGILAATVGVPSLMVSYDPKVTAFAKSIDGPQALPIEGLSAQRLFENFQSFIKDRDRYAQIIDRKRSELTRQAMVNVQVVVEGLKGAPVGV